MLMYRGRKGIFEHFRHICWTGCSALFFVWIITDMDDKQMLLEPESDTEDDPAPGNEVTISHKSVRPGE